MSTTATINGHSVIINIKPIGGAQAAPEKQGDKNPVCPQGYIYSPLALQCIPISKGHGDLRGFSVAEKDIKMYILWKAYNNQKAFRLALIDQGITVPDGLSQDDFAKTVLALYTDSATFQATVLAADSVQYNPLTQNWTNLPQVRVAVLNFENNYNK